MVDRSALKNVLVIADRGYEGFNLMAHIQEKNWCFLIRIQDVLTSKGIAAGLDLPNTEEFDISVDLALTTKQTNEVKLEIYGNSKVSADIGSIALDILNNT